MTRTFVQLEDPLVRPRRQALRWRFALCATVPMLTWALWPLTAPYPFPASAESAGSAIAAGLTHPPSQSTPMQRPPVQIAVFDAQLWTLDPPPAAPVAPPLPLRLQLVGIVRDAERGGGGGGGRESLKAVIYDPDKDELIVVSQGTKLGSRTITAIDPRGVTLSDASGLRRLLMEEGVP